jgi:hypothetical protein
VGGGVDKGDEGGVMSDQYKSVEEVERYKAHPLMELRDDFMEAANAYPWLKEGE